MFDPVAELGRRQRPGAAMAFIGGIEQAQVALCEGELGHCLGVRRLACECVLASLGGFVGPAARVVHRGQRGARIGVIRVEHQRQATQGLGFVSVFPYDEGARPPDASTLNYAPGQTVPNHAIARTGPYIGFYNANGRAHLIVDVFGAFL